MKLKFQILNCSIIFSPEGYLPVAQILQHKSFRSYTALDIERVVSNNNKQRFKLRTHPQTNVLEIKATQGHSLNVSDAELIPLLEVRYKYYFQTNTICIVR